MKTDGLPHFFSYSKGIPKVIKSEAFPFLFQKSLSHKCVHGWFRPGVDISVMPSTPQMGVMDSSLQTLAPASQSFPLALQFPLFPLTSSVCCFIFCCNVYKAFLYVFSSKTNVKSAPLTCTAGLLCMWMQVFHTSTSVCVCPAHSLLCDCARLLSILIFSHVSLLESKSRPHSSGSPPPAS